MIDDTQVWGKRSLVSMVLYDHLTNKDVKIDARSPEEDVIFSV